MDKKKILLSGGRAPMVLDLVRNLASLDHDVYIAETTRLHICRFSRFIKGSFVVASPRFSPKEHIKGLMNIINEHKIDLFIPTWEDIYLVAKHLDSFPKHCTVFASPFDLLHKVHNKYLFIQLLQDHHFAIPKTVLIHSIDELQKVALTKYALKACYSRGSAKVYKMEAGSPLPDIRPTPHSPWIAQEWIDGKSYCSFSICQKGKVHAHVTYPTEIVLQRKNKEAHAVEGNCLTFRSISHPAIYRWVETFVSKTSFTGQIGFDFIEREDGTIYAIECNPRMTHGAILFSPQDRIDLALFNENETVITPFSSKGKQIAIGMILYGFRAAWQKNEWSLFLRKLFTCRDIIFSSKDLRPFLSYPILLSKYLIDSKRYKTSIPAAFTYDLDFDG